MFQLNIWFIAFLATSIWLVVSKLTEPEISVKNGLKYMKKALVRMIVFYQSHYSETDQVFLIKSWLNNIDISKVPKEQWELFKEYINNLNK